MGIENFFNKYCILIIFSLISLSLAHEHSMVESQDIIKVPSTVLIHGVIMTIILLITFPLGYGLILHKKYNEHKIVQIFNIITITLFSAYAYYKFSSHKTVHAKLGRIIVILLFVQLFIPLLKYINLNYKLSIHNILFNIHKYNGIFIILLLFPSQWILGIWHTMTGSDFMGNSPNLGHIGPGLGFYMLGIIYIWYRDNLLFIKKYEIFFLIVFPSIELYFELLKNNLGAAGYDHIFLDILYIFGGILLLLFNFFSYITENNYDINKWHHYTVGFCTMIYGYTLMNHVHKGLHKDGIQGMHRLAGYTAFIGGVFRAYGNIYFTGIIAVIHAMLFMASNPLVTNAWYSNTPFPGEAYIIIVFMIGFYCAAIHSLLFYIKEYVDNYNNNNNTIKYNNNNYYNNYNNTSNDTNNNNHYHHHTNHINNNNVNTNNINGADKMNHLVILNDMNSSELATLINHDNNERNEKNDIDNTL